MAVLAAAIAWWADPAAAAAVRLPRLEAKPVADSIVVRAIGGAPITRLVPGDTILVDAYLSDADGFADIDRADLTIAWGTDANFSNPSEGASFRWRRAGVPPWSQTSSTSSWQLDPAQCWADTALTATDARLVRFAIRVSPIARATSAGDWHVFVTVPSIQTDGVLGGLDMAERITVVEWSPSGSFQQGTPGETALALVEPTTGAIHLGVQSNAPWRVRGRATRFNGMSVPAAGFNVLAQDSTLIWKSPPGGSVQGVVDSSLSLLLDGLARSTTDSPIAQDVGLTLRLPAGLSNQTYLGSLDLRLALASGSDSVALSVPLQAPVGTSQAATSAVAEISPTQVVAGTVGQSLTAYMWVVIDPGDAGVRRLMIGLPPGYSAPRVTQVRMGFSSVSFQDSSTANTVIARLSSTQTADTYFEVRFSVDAPQQANPTGASFGVLVDDLGTTANAVVAVPGSANVFVPSNQLDVTVTPGPLASLSLTPSAASMSEVDTLRFSVAPTDAYGNPLSASVSWQVTGGLGFVSPSGLFTATTPGTGRVIAQSGAIADTADVTIVPSAVSSNLRVTAIAGAGGAVLPGGPVAEVLRFRISNQSPNPETLDRVDLSDVAIGPGSAAELDASWTDVALWLAPSGAGGETYQRSASFSGGVASFESLMIAIPPGDSIEIALRAGAALLARDGDLLRAALLNGNALTFASGGAASASWPLFTASPFTVDGMSAAQIGFFTPSAGITVGSRRQPVAVLDVPSNGYAADTLRRANLLQLGDASPATDLTLLELWADDGSGSFEESADTNLGALPWTGDRWERTGLALPVPVPGRRLFVTADAAETAAEGAVLRLALPSLPDVAFGMSSGNSGPVDAARIAPADVVISVADRVTLAAVDLPGEAVAPGQRDVRLLALDLHNTYSSERALTLLRVQNHVQGPGTLAQRDAELTRLDLRDDANGNGVLDDAATDPVLASGLLVDGRASFTGFSMPIATGQTRRLFVTGGVSQTGAADGDRLAVSIISALDVAFAPAGVMAAAWPVASLQPPVVDGMIAGQIGIPGAVGATLGPGDGPVEAFDLVVPRNGYLDDELTGVRITNAGSASSGDLAELRLWRDGGDGAFDAGDGDDRDLGPLARIGPEWRSPILAEALGAAGARLFVSVTVAAAPADSVTLRLRVPVNGISTASANQGPRDTTVENPDDLLLSTAPLLGALRISPLASTIGQVVPLRLTVKNVGGESVTGIVPILAGAEGTGTLTVTGGPNPASANLDPGGEVTFEWPARADAPGDVRVSAYAQGTGFVSGLPRRSLFGRSNQHQVYLGAADVSMFAVESMPFAVDRGQTGVVPLSLTFEHPGSADASDIRVDRITLRLENQTGADVVPASLLTRVAFAEGATTYLERTSLETSGGVVVMDLARPVLISPGNPVTVALHLDISDTTTVPDFRVMIPDSTGFIASDATSGAPVVVRLLGTAYPVQSGLARVLTGARELRVDATPETLRASRGQTLARLGVLRVQNTTNPVVGTEVRVGRLRFRLTDTNGTPHRNLHQTLGRVVARSVLGTHADRAATPADSAEVSLDFASFFSVPAGATIDVELLADLRIDAVLGCYSSMLEDSSWIETRDPNTGEIIPVRLARSPLEAGTLVVEAPAETLAVSGRPEFPTTAGIGRPGLPALTLTLRHPGSAGASRTRTDSLAFELLDAGRQRVAPGQYLDRVVVLRRGTPIATLFDPPATAIAASIPLPGLLLEAGTRDTLTLVVDIDAAAPTGSIEMVVRETGWHVVEANAGGNVRVVAEAGENLPFSSGVLRLDAPARRLEVGLTSLIPAALPPDGAETPFATLRLMNTAATGAGPIDVASLRIVAKDEANSPVSVGAAAERIVALVNGVPWAASAPLTADSISATLLASAMSVPAGGAVDVQLRLVPRRGWTGTRFRLGLDRSDVGVVQPGSSLLSIAVEAAAGTQFPLWTDLTSIADAALAGSYANFPNPFAAGREPTTFVYALEQSSRVTLRIWTLRGELVRTLLEGAAFGSGLRQSEFWDGRNGAGRLVANGVYVAELIVEPDGAPGERLLRKVAVLR